MGVRDENGWSWRRDGVVLLFAMLYPTLATWLYFVVLAGEEWVKIAYGIGKAVQFALPLVWVWFVQRQRPRWHAPGKAGLGAGLGFGLVVLLAMLGLYYGYLRDSRYLAAAPQAVWEKLADFGATTEGRFLVFVSFIAVIHSLLEEYYWRWFVFGQLRRALPVWLALGLSSLAFALHHVIVVGTYVHSWYAVAIFSLAVAAGGGMWAWIYHRGGSLYGPWLSHFLVDAGLMWIGFDLCRRFFP